MVERSDVDLKKTHNKVWNADPLFVTFFYSQRLKYFQICLQAISPKEWLSLKEEGHLIISHFFFFLAQYYVAILQAEPKKKKKKEL